MMMEPPLRASSTLDEAMAEQNKKGFNTETTIEDKSKSLGRIIFSKSGEYLSVKVSSIQMSEKAQQSHIKKHKLVQYRCRKSFKLMNIDSRLVCSFNSNDKLSERTLYISDTRIKYDRAFLLSFMEKSYIKGQKRKRDSSLERVDLQPAKKRSRTLDYSFSTTSLKELGSSNDATYLENMDPPSISGMKRKRIEESPNLRTFNSYFTTDLDGEESIREKYPTDRKRRKLNDHIVKNTLITTAKEEPLIIASKGEIDNKDHDKKQGTSPAFQQLTLEFNPLSGISDKRWKALTTVSTNLKNKGVSRGHRKSGNLSRSFPPNINSYYNRSCVPDSYKLGIRILMDHLLIISSRIDTDFAKCTSDIDQESFVLLFCSCQNLTSIWFLNTICSRSTIDIENIPTNDIDQENLEFLFCSCQHSTSICPLSLIHHILFLLYIFSRKQNDFKRELIFVVMSHVWDFWIHRKLTSFIEVSPQTPDVASCTWFQFKYMSIMSVFVALHLLE